MKWIKCSERMPDGEYQYDYVLTYSQSLGYELLYYLFPENTWHTGGGSTYPAEMIRHWMRLPEAPKE